VKPTPLRRLLRLTAPVRGWLLLAVLASFGALAANIALMTAAPYLISRATLVTGFAALSVAVTAVRAFAVARVGLRYSERYVVHVAALRILTEIRVWLFRAIEPLAPGGLGGFRSGDLLARTVADVDALDAFFVRGLVPPVAAAFAVAFACAILAAFEPALALVLLAFLAIGGLAVPRRRAAAPVARPSGRSRLAPSCTPG
jgi:ABC-type transport system involved in cytochrome bd biosynthesis fused ATPase/permease subunit